MLVLIMKICLTVGNALNVVKKAKIWSRRYVEIIVVKKIKLNEVNASL